MSAGPQPTIGCGDPTTLPPDPPDQPPPAPADTVPPVVTLTVRRNGNSTNYTATTTATDNVGVTRFELALNGRVLYRAAGAYTLSIKQKGSNVVTATAWDAAGNSKAVSWTVTR